MVMGFVYSAETFFITGFRVERVRKLGVRVHFLSFFCEKERGPVKGRFRNSHIFDGLPHGDARLRHPLSRWYHTGLPGKRGSSLLPAGYTGVATTPVLADAPLRG
jgi:hypothetical protein